MPSTTEGLIDSLVEELKPVSSMSMRAGLLRTGLGACVTLLALVLTVGLRPDLIAGHFDPVFLLASGALLILSYAAAFGAIQMSQPFVGNRQTGWRWASAMAALLPATALLILARSRTGGSHVELDGEGWQCTVAGMMTGLLVAVVLAHWLRRGAPSSPERAGLLTGVAAGAFGIFAFGLYCPHNDIAHIGIWHGMAVVGSAMVGRLVVPRLVRW